MMLKKILAAGLAAVLLAVSLTGCMGASTVEKLTVLPTEEGDWREETFSASGYDGDLDGLCAFMEEAGVVADDDAYPVETNYELLGAVGGQRYKFTYNNSTVQAEFYEFDPEALNEEAQALLADAQAQGRVTVLGNTVPAEASDDNRFLMIYIDTKNDERNTAHREKGEYCFTLFCKEYPAG